MNDNYYLKRVFLLIILFLAGWFIWENQSKLNIFSSPAKMTVKKKTFIQREAEELRKK